MINENTCSKIMKLTSGGIVFKLKKEHDTIRILYDYGRKDFVKHQLLTLIEIWKDVDWFKIKKTKYIKIKKGVMLVEARRETVIYDNR